MGSVFAFATEVDFGRRPVSLINVVRKFGATTLRDAIAIHNRDLAAGRPVRGIEVVRDAGPDTVIVFSDRTFLSASSLCGLVSNPPPPRPPFDQQIKAMIANVLPGSFKMRSDSSASLSNECTAQAELATTGSGNIRIIVRLPRNHITLILTTPDVGPIGLPGSLDPRATLTFDIEVNSGIIVPTKFGTPLTSENSTAVVTNVNMVPENFTAEAAVAVNDVVKFLGGPDFLKGLKENRVLELGDRLRGPLDRFNTELNQLFPPDVTLTFVPTYDRGPETLVLVARN